MSRIQRSLFRVGAAIAIAALPALTSPSRLTAQAPCVLGLGTRAVALGGSVTVRILPASADFTSDISVLKTGATVGEYHFPLGSSADGGDEVDAGVFARGSELRFFIDVDPTGYEFSTGPASRNLDGLAHAKVTQVDADTVRVEFEDFLGASDRDFDDVVFEVDGARPRVSFAGLPGEPKGDTRLGCEAGGDLLLSPIVLGGGVGLELPLGPVDGWRGSFSPRGAPRQGAVEAVARDLRDGAKIATRGEPTLDGQLAASVGFAASRADLPIEVERFRDGVSLGRSFVAGTPEPGGLIRTPKVFLGCPWGELLQPDWGQEQECDFDAPVPFCAAKVECVRRAMGRNEPDEVRFKLEDPAPTSRQPIGSIEVVGGGLQSLAIGDPGLLRFGRAHAALGQAELHPSAAGLALEELGASGEDGVVKLFDGRSINGAWWVYEAGLSRRAYRLTVVDLEHGTRKVYLHPRGGFSSRVDDGAFGSFGGDRADSGSLGLASGTIDAPVAPGATGCVASATTLCLAHGRFEVEVVARGSGAPRPAGTVPLGDGAGYFWLTEAAAADVFVKALPKPGGGWAIVRGSLTRSLYELRVRDRATGEVRSLR